MYKNLQLIKSRIKEVSRLFKPRPCLVKHKTDGWLNFCHISAFNYGNTGDTLLPIVLRDLFNQSYPIKSWSEIHVSKEVDKQRLKHINSKSAVIIGGGGLFLKDTNINNISGWQWKCSSEAIKAIEVPIIIFAVGYNRFRGQEEFEPYFASNINALVSKARFVGLRNHGSIAKVREYLESEELKKRVTFQPCMTTLISKIYPNYTDYNTKEDFIAINCAFDRSELRGCNDNTLPKIAQVALELSKITKIKYYSHMKSDCNILKYFDLAGLEYELVEFSNIGDVVKMYSKPRLVIGMRGHAQMIPFGCLTPILSIISHDKMQWFLDDIHHAEWGVDLREANLEELLLTRATEAYNNYEELRKDIIYEQSLLWNITMQNLDIIKKSIRI